MKKIILGIDVGIAITGWSVIDNNDSSKLKLIDYGAITTAANTSIENRLLFLQECLEEVVHAYQPTEMAVESLFYFKNQKTIIAVSQARGVILYTGAKHGLIVAHYTPLQVKTSVTGYGRATKEQVQQMVTSIFNLKETPKPDDVADAIAVGYCHCSSSGFNEKTI